MEVGEPRLGQLLVARDPGDGGFFDRSVVLLLSHDDEGSVGVCLHHPLPIRLDDDSALERLLTPPATIFKGGPVSDETDPEPAYIGLAQLRRPYPWPRGWRPVFGDVGTLDLSVPVDPIGGDFAHLRVFMGYAGWSPGQLIAELLRGMWFRTHALAEEVFGTPDELWRRVLRRCGGDAALWSTWTDLPAKN